MLIKFFKRGRRSNRDYGRYCQSCWMFFLLNKAFEFWKSLQKTLQNTLLKLFKRGTRQIVATIYSTSYVVFLFFNEIISLY